MRLTISSTLSGDNFSEQKPRAAVATVAPALEIIEQRLPPGKESGFVVGVDNGEKRAFMVGEEKEYAPAINDLDKVSCEVYVDGNTRNEPMGLR